MTEEDFDLELHMLYLQRSIDPIKLPGHHTVVRFHLTDFCNYDTWWLLVEQNAVDVCS
ncbi:MAG: hypothetical protein HRT77_13400 [Halioglobus sp.]|nr:hypothetical protein [Halioglobus sp.]